MSPLLPFTRRRPRPVAGFSLVEIVVALAVVATAVLTMVALLPSGLDDLRKSASRQADARIAQAVVADYQMQSWGAPSATMTLPGKDFYFDIRGTEVDIKVESGKLEHAFTARAQVKSDPAKPALAGDRDSTRQLLRLSIRITDKINNPDALEDGSKFFRERGVWVANFDQTKLGGIKAE